MSMPTDALKAEWPTADSGGGDAHGERQAAAIAAKSATPRFAVDQQLSHYYNAAAAQYGGYGSLYNPSYYRFPYLSTNAASAIYGRSILSAERCDESPSAGSNYASAFDYNAAAAAAAYPSYGVQQYGHKTMVGAHSGGTSPIASFQHYTVSWRASIARLSSRRLEPARRRRQFERGGRCRSCSRRLGDNERRRAAAVVEMLAARRRSLLSTAAAALRVAQNRRQIEFVVRRRHLRAFDSSFARFRENKAQTADDDELKSGNRV